MARHSALSILSWLQLLLCSIATADDFPTVIMTYPPRARDNQPKIYFSPTEQVRFNWTSTFPRISLELYQGPQADGHWVMFPLLTNVSNTTNTFFDWDARVLPTMTRDDSFHLRLFNSNGADCNRCHSNSSLFEIKQAATTSTSISFTTSDASTDTTTSTPNSDSSADSNSHSLKLGLGLGLGLGIPLLIILSSLATWVCVRRKRRERKVQSASTSQQGELLSDWKEARPEISAAPAPAAADGGGAKAELGGRSVVEMAAVSDPSEAPDNNSARAERVELEGDSRHT